MKKTTLFIGLNDKDSKRQEIPTLEAYKVIANICAHEIGGATITEGTGVYTHEDGTVVVETTLVCQIFGVSSDAEEIKSAIKQIKSALNQESIAVEDTETKSAFM